MVLNVIIAVSLLQIALYSISDWRKIPRYGRTIILIFVLIGHFLVLPKLFYPKLDPDGVNCGMPIVGITLAFWIIGGLTSGVLHIVYPILHRRWQKTVK